MSLNLLFIMTALLLADYVVGLLYGIWNEGFDKEKCIKGAQKHFLIFAGYGALALIAYVSAMRLPEMEYLSGLLLDPIARYFLKLLDRMKEFMARDTAKAASAAPVPEVRQEVQSETVVTAEAAAPAPEKPAASAKPAARAKPTASTRAKKPAQPKSSQSKPAQSATPSAK